MSDNSTLTFVTESLSMFTVGAPFDQTLETAGGYGAVTFTIQSGEFPDGIQLSSQGVINGTPTDDRGDTTVFITATDESGAHLTQAFDCQVSNPQGDQD